MTLPTVDITVKDVLEGYIIEDISEKYVNNIKDPIQYLLSYNIEEVSQTHFIRKTPIDNATFGRIDDYGKAPESSKAHYRDRTYLTQDLDLSNSEELSFVISRDDFHLYGLSYDLFSMSASGNELAIASAIAAIRPELVNLVIEAQRKDRSEMSVILDELGNSSNPFVLPYNQQIIAASRADGIWNFSNKSSAAFDQAEYDADINAGYKQLSIKGAETGPQTPIIGLAGSAVSAMMKIHMPNKVSDITKLSIADLADMPRMVGTYTTSHTSDWITVSDYALQAKTFRTLIHSSYITKTPVSLTGTGQDEITLKGWKIEIIVDRINGQIVFKIERRREFAIESPEGWYKGVVGH